MTSEGPDASSSPRDGSAGGSSARPAAAADLLQMWVGAGAPREPEPAVAVDDDAVEEAAPLWPADDRTDAAAETSEDAPAAADAGDWWPYDDQAAARPADQTPEPDAVVPEAPTAASPVEAAAPAPTESGWTDDVETEWSDADAAESDAESDAETAVVTSDAEPGVASGATPGPDESRERGWASFGAAQTAEDVLDQIGREDGWAQTPAAPAEPDAATGGGTESETAAPEVDEEPVTAPTPIRARQGLDLSATTHWSLDDFESYIRAQGSNELAGWMAGGTPAAPETDDPAPEAAVVDDDAVEAPAVQESAAETPLLGEAAADTPVVDEQVVDQPAAEDDVAPEPTWHDGPEPAGEQTVAWVPATPATEPEPSTEPTSDQAEDEPDTAPRKRGLLAKMGLTREPEVEPETSTEDDPAAALEQPPTGDAYDWTEPDVAWDAEPASDHAAEPGLFAAPADATPEPAARPDGESVASAAEAWDPDATQYFDWTIHDLDPDDDSPEVGSPHVGGPDAASPSATAGLASPEDVPLPVSGPVGLEAAGGAATTSGKRNDESAPEPEPLAEPAAASDAEDEHDHQEWYDDQGLRWASDDGGYTWFSEDGQGWNAETGEPIDMSTLAPTAAALPEPGADTGHASTGRTSTDGTDDSWPTRATEDPEDVWPSSPDDTVTTTPAFWPEPESAADTPAATESHTGPDADPYATLYAAPDATAVAAPLEVAAQPPTSAAAPAGTGPAPEIPPFVEYKPRGAYRPILGVLFVAAAILAVVAIFWAVSKGSQAATGIAAGVTGFALAFWWGLLSWTPTVVSLSGSVLEVARGSDGERFDLRSPKLVIDVDEDIDSRNWRTTITRPNGTELVIPASAVDPEEFSRIVRHYRAEVASTPGSPA